jgi:restriction endonuclease Mrr
MCGWWSYRSEGDSTDGVPEFHSVAALLKEFAGESPEVPLEALAAHVSRNPETIHSMSPAKVEELVGSIYSELFGYEVEYCSYGRPDRGIDLIVVKSETDTIAIQVKRHRRPIELGVIHQFFGALVSADRKEDVFLTTGRFRAGAQAEAAFLSSKTSVSISLVDGRRFLDFIGILNSRRQKPMAADFPFWRAHPYFG